MHTPPLKIAGIIFGSLLKMGGYQVFAHNLFSRLHGRGHTVDLYIPRREYVQNKPFYRSLPYAVRPIFFKTKSFVKYAPDVLGAYLKARHRRAAYDIWQIVGAYPAGYLAASLSGAVPLVLRTHGDDIQTDAALHYGLRLDAGWAQKIRSTLHRMDRLVALTESITECYRELDIPESKIIEIPNGTDICRFQQPFDARHTRRKWGLPADRPLLLTVGRNHPKKGFDTIPQVAHKLKQEGLSFSWLVVGQNTDQLAPLIRRYGVADRVRTTGEIGISSDCNLDMPHDDLIRLYQCADAFVFPSRLESFGRVLVEALAAGLPVVTTNAPGCKYVIEHGQTGLCSDPDDIRAIAANIQTLLGSKSLHTRLVENGRRKAADYDWDVVVDTYERLYRSLLPSGSK